MKNAIQNIVEAEKEFNNRVEEVRAESKRKINELRSRIANEKPAAINAILKESKERKKTTIEDALKKAEQEQAEISKEKEFLIANAELCKTVKERIISILLE
ncbi:MAG: hypothetical protein GY754_00605 [bacterium]|nr:hypothetical protein [bacterium]